MLVYHNPVQQNFLAFSLGAQARAMTIVRTVNPDAATLLYWVANRATPK